jgi:hypothetical protein
MLPGFSGQNKNMSMPSIVNHQSSIVNRQLNAASIRLVRNSG